jgi:signal transduction histidine kinase
MDAKPLRVLVIEDNPADARFIREMLREHKGIAFQVEEAGQLSSGLERLANAGADAVLIDLALPDSHGLDTFLRAQSAAPAVPFIVLTGLDDDAVATRAVHSGAQDYLTKGSIDSGALARSIRYAVERKQIEETLRQVVALLDRKNQELDTFTYSVSHDLKEPLRTLEAFSQFLLEDYSDRLDDQGRDYLTKLARASARMKRQIEDLSTLSRIGRQTEPLTRVGMSQIIAEIAEGMRALVEEQGGAIDVEDGLPDVLGDRLRVEQIFANLIGNALKFTSEPPHVQVTVRAVDGTAATFAIRDNGIGIDPQYHGRIFGVFQRLHRREDYDGTGAGLAIVKRAAEALDGRVWVESALGEGATFLVRLPLWQQAVEQPVQEAA